MITYLLPYLTILIISIVIYILYIREIIKDFKLKGIDSLTEIDLLLIVVYLFVLFALSTLKYSHLNIYYE